MGKSVDDRRGTAPLPQALGDSANLKHWRWLVCCIAQRLAARLPASVSMDDLVQAGMIGLHDAMTRFDSHDGAAFQTFAAKRIRGAMIDELRGVDWASRGHRREQRCIATVEQKLGHVLGRRPCEREMADAMGLSLPEFQKRLANLRGASLVSIDDVGVLGDDGETPEHLGAIPDVPDASHQRELQLRESLLQAIGRLSERDQSILTMYYEGDMNLKEIGHVLGVTESRTCQLHSRLIARLRQQMLAD